MPWISLLSKVRSTPEVSRTTTDVAVSDIKVPTIWVPFLNLKVAPQAAALTKAITQKSHPNLVNFTPHGLFRCTRLDQNIS